MNQRQPGGKKCQIGPLLDNAVATYFTPQAGTAGRFDQVAMAIDSGDHRKGSKDDGLHGREMFTVQYNFLIGNIITKVCRCVRYRAARSPLYSRFSLRQSTYLHVELKRYDFTGPDNFPMG